jgi:2-amino-4-hydroxy-6-hydroxymethyldihydropteridine diphosphokinase
MVNTVTAQHPVRCYIAIGSNQGERLALCNAAIDQLAALPQSRLGRRSSWYETEPMIDSAAHAAEREPLWFINGVLELHTTLMPRELIDACLRIEQRFGRDRAAGLSAPLSRPIDLDLLFYGDAVINEPGLTVPHPRLHLRRFVLEPLAEIAPGLVHPLLRTTIGDLLNRLDDPHTVRRIEPATASPTHHRGV